MGRGANIIGGALSGLAPGIMRGYQIGSDISSRRLAERRAETVEAREAEKLGILKSSAEEEGIDRVRLRAEKIADAGISSDFEKAPAEQQTAVFNDISASLVKAVPDENQRALVTEQIMETTLKAKKDEARALAGDLEYKRATASARTEPKEKDPVQAFKNDLSVSEKTAWTDIQRSMDTFDPIKFPDATEQEKTMARKKMGDARAAIEKIQEIRAELDATPFDQQAVKIEEIRAAMRKPPKAPSAVPVGIEKAKKIISESAAGGMSAEKLINEIGQEAGYNEAQKQELMEFVRHLERGKTGGKAQADTSYPDTSPGGRQIFPF